MKKLCFILIADLLNTCAFAQTPSRTAIPKVIKDGFPGYVEMVGSAIKVVPYVAGIKPDGKLVTSEVWHGTAVLKSIENKCMKIVRTDFSLSEKSGLQLPKFVEQKIEISCPDKPW